LNASATARIQKTLLSPRDEFDFMRTFAPDKLRGFPYAPEKLGVNIAAVGAMTVGIAQFFPDLVGRDHLDIIVAGAAVPELLAVAFGEEIMRHWLEVDDVAFQFCGPGISDSIEAMIQNSMQMALPDADTIMNCMLAHLMWQRRVEQAPFPDMITVLHPGIEYSRECWLKDQGLREAAENGVPILLSAFAEREMHADRTALEAYGYALSEPFQHRGAPSSDFLKSKPGKSTESADPDPRYGSWLYTITGVDTKRWRNPDQELLAKALAKSSKPMFVGNPQREQILGVLHAAHRGGNAYARMEDGVKLKNAARFYNHPLFSQRSRLHGARLGHPDPNDYYSGQLLRYGAGLGFSFVMPYLARNPDALEARDEEGCTVVFHAIHYGHDDGLANTELLEHLLGTADLSVVNDQALTPLQVAVQRNNFRAVELLLDAGAPLLSPPGAREMVQFLVDHDAWPLLRRLVSQYPDAAARAAENPVLVPQLLNAGAPAPIVKCFRAWWRPVGPARPAVSVAVKQGQEDDVFKINAADAVKLMMAGHSLLRWTSLLDLVDPLNMMEVALAAELGDAELHRAIRAAEETGQTMHGAGFTLYGAMVPFVVMLMGGGLYGDAAELSAACESIRQVNGAIASNGPAPTTLLLDRAVLAHVERHKARYAADAKG
jgi:hypothetical protein